MLEKNARKPRLHLPSLSFFKAWNDENGVFLKGYPKGSVANRETAAIRSLGFPHDSAVRSVANRAGLEQLFTDIQTGPLKGGHLFFCLARWGSSLGPPQRNPSCDIATDLPPEQVAKADSR